MGMDVLVFLRVKEIKVRGKERLCLAVFCEAWLGICLG